MSLSDAATERACARTEEQWVTANINGRAARAATLAWGSACVHWAFAVTHVLVWLLPGKSLGQIAYERIRAQQHPPHWSKWENISPSTQAAWCAAADAVVDESRRRAQ